MPRDETRVRLVIFDWAGTAVDHGSRAPLIPFVRAFAARGVVITPEEARGPMGLSKKDHLRALLQLPTVARRWRERHGGDATEDDVDELYRRFMPAQLEVINQFAGVVPGLLDCVDMLQSRGVAVGATTGYFREAAERVYRCAAAQGYRPDHCVCAEEVPAGRPAPWRLGQEPAAPGVLEAGIHILTVQDPDGSFVVGDSHEYGTGDLSEFLDARLEVLILSEARKLIELANWEVAERWQGVYGIPRNGELYRATIDEVIHVVTGIRGKGMTTGPAVARETIDALAR